MPFAVIVMQGHGRTVYEAAYGPFPTEEAAED
jgi:hypothetical protein